MRPALPVRFFHIFLEFTVGEIGWDVIRLVLDRAGIPADHFTPETIAKLNPESAAKAYTQIQQAMRVYYGRGARGLLTRIGRKMWDRFLREASWIEKLQLAFVHLLPKPMRIKPTLQLCSSFMQTDPGSVTIHTLDMDFMLVDNTGCAALVQTGNEAVCHVTLGLLQEALFWAIEKEYDIVEESCHAKGSDACEFRIRAMR